MNSPPFSAARSFWSIPTAIAVGLQLAAWLAMLLWVQFRVPFYRKLFEEHAVELPTVAEWVIRLSDLLVSYWWGVIPAVLIVIAVISTSVDLSLERVNRIGLRLIWQVVMLQLPLLIFLLSLGTLASTYYQLLDQLSG